MCLSFWGQSHCRWKPENHNSNPNPSRIWDYCSLKKRFLPGNLGEKNIVIVKKKWLQLLFKERKKHVYCNSLRCNNGFLILRSNHYFLCSLQVFLTTAVFLCRRSWWATQSWCRATGSKSTTTSTTSTCSFSGTCTTGGSSNSVSFLSHINICNMNTKRNNKHKYAAFF